MWTGDMNNFDEVVSYLNSELCKGRTQKEIEINDFKVNERVIAKRLTSRGYKKIDNQYVKCDKSSTGVINKGLEEYDNDNTEVTQSEKIRYDNSNTLVINKKEIQNKIIGLAQNYDKILKIIEEYDKQYDKEYDGITVELPIENIKDFRTSIRVNNVIWEQFNEFVSNHKEFTKRDLLSMALKEYMENHK